MSAYYAVLTRAQMEVRRNLVKVGGEMLGRESGANAAWLPGTGLAAVVAPSGTGELFGLSPALHATRLTVSSALTGTSAQHAIGSEYRNSRTTMSQDVITIGHVWRF